MANKPDLSQVKKRLNIESDEPSPKKENPEWKPEMRQETANMAKKFMDEVSKTETVEEEPIEKVDLGELPEGVSAEPEDDVFYSNTSYDNRAVRTSIENNCSKMDFADLVISGRVSQQVPIIPGKLEVVYQSLLGTETYWIGQNVEKNSTTAATMQEWMGYARLALSISSVNGRAMPEVGDDLNAESFGERFNAVMGMAEPVLRMMLVNLGWFNLRVDELYADDFGPLKNG